MRDLRRAAWERDGGRCVVTGAPLGDVDADTWHLHHRRPGGMGGTRREEQDSLPNVICLLPQVHNLGGGAELSVHGHPAWSGPRGYLLPTREWDPAGVPLLLHGRRWVFLTADGGYAPVT